MSEKKSEKKPKITHMTDAKGEQVPVAYVNAYDRERDRLARRVLARHKKARAMLERVYAETMEDIEKLETLAQGSAIPLGGARGNLAFQSFDGLIQVDREARYEMRFDERLTAAKAAIERFIQEKTGAIDDDTAILLRGAFSTNSDGMLSHARVLGLFRYRIKHPLWLEAMELIKASIESRRGKTLVHAYEREVRGGKWVLVELDISKCAGIPDAEGEDA